MVEKPRAKIKVAKEYYITITWELQRLRRGVPKPRKALSKFNFTSLLVHDLSSKNVPLFPSPVSTKGREVDCFPPHKANLRSTTVRAKYYL
jgi:hypothetical protein